jgi:hypothetical protein
MLPCVHVSHEVNSTMQFWQKALILCDNIENAKFPGNVPHCRQQYNPNCWSRSQLSNNHNRHLLCIWGKIMISWNVLRYVRELIALFCDDIVIFSVVGVDITDIHLRFQEEFNMESFIRSCKLLWSKSPQVSTVGFTGFSESQLHNSEKIFLWLRCPGLCFCWNRVTGEWPNAVPFDQSDGVFCNLANLDGSGTATTSDYRHPLIVQSTIWQEISWGQLWHWIKMTCRLYSSTLHFIIESQSR